jgi:hypothetical protein
MVSLLAVCLTGLAAPNVPIIVCTGHYEKPTSGLSGDASFLVFTSYPAFDQVLGCMPPIGNRKSHPMTESLFSEYDVVVVILRKKGTTTYSEVTARMVETTLNVSYRMETNQTGSDLFASPLVLAVPKGSAQTVAYLENGKPVGK